MSSSVLRGLNSTNVPLPSGIRFQGKSEFVGSLLTVLVNCYADTTIRVDCYENAVASDTTQEVSLGSTYIAANTLTQIPLNLSFPNFRLDVANTSGSNQLQLNINTVYTNLLPLDTGAVINISGTVAVSSVAGVVDISGNVVSTPALNPAQLRQMPLEVGHWYQVASAGDTPPAVWTEIGAIWDGESTPPVGRQFQCLYAGYGTGTCHDITAPMNTLPTSVSVVSPLPAGTNIIGVVGFDTTNNFVRFDPANNIVRIDDGTLPLAITIDTDGNTVKIDPASSLPAGTNSIGTVVVSDSNSTIIVTEISNALPTGTNVIGKVGLDATGGGNTIQISQTGTDNGVVVYGSLPEGTNVIGKVILETGTNQVGSVGIDATLNTIKIDQSSIATNGVRIIDPVTFSARVTTASSTGVLVTTGGHLLNFLAVNLSTAIDAYIKLYDSASAPNPAIAIPFMIAHVSRDAASRLPTIQVNTANLPISSKLWVRAVTGSADTNTDATGVSVDLCFFGTAT